MKSILLTRPFEDSQELAKTIIAAGYDVFIEPLFAISHMPSEPVDLSVYNAFVFTSKNAIRMYQAHFDFVDKPVFTVGQASGELATSVGFTKVNASGNDLKDLSILIKKHNPSPTLHIRGEETAGALGIHCDELVIYKKLPAQVFSEDLIEKIKQSWFAGVTFMSPQTVEIFNSLVSKHNLSYSFQKCTAFCISANTAAKLDAKIWKNISIAQAPNKLALVEKILENENDESIAT